MTLVFLRLKIYMVLRAGWKQMATVFFLLIIYMVLRARLKVITDSK